MLRKRNLTKATEKLIISRQELYGYIVISRGLIYQLGDFFR